MKKNSFVQKDTFINSGRRRKRAFLLFFIYTISLFVGLMPSSFAAVTPPMVFYNDLIKIHGDNPDSPKWSYAEFCTRIQQISDYTISPASNRLDEYINPYVYEYYNQQVVYGRPHGKVANGTSAADFYVTKSGNMFNITNGKQGEYRYLGYNEAGIDVTNDRWHNSTYTGTGQFASAADYTELTYSEIQGAPFSWDSLDSAIRNYIMRTKFFDDDYITHSYTPFSISDLWNEAFINKHILVQAIPGIARSGSLKMVYGTHHNTLIIDPIPFSWSASLTTDKSVYRIPAGTNEVTVDVTMNANFSDTLANTYLKDIEFNCKDTNSTLITVTQAGKDYKYQKKLTFDRSMLNVGSNNVPITGTVQVNSKYKDYQNKTVSKTVTIIVEENPEPWVEGSMTATPKLIEFKGSNMPVTLDISYEIKNFTDLNKINNVQIKVKDEGTFTKPAAISGKHTMNVTIPASYMSGYETRDKSYEVDITYNLKDGRSFTKKTAAGVKIVKYNPTLTPSVTAVMTATPNSIKFNNADMPVKLDISYSISNTELSKIRDIYVMVAGEGSYTKAATITGVHTQNVTIPAYFMSGYDKRDRLYESYVQYNLKDGTSYKGYVTASVTITRDTITVTPTPIQPTPTPISNYPPSVRLTAPSTVKAGEKFNIRADASDPEGDALEYHWGRDNSSGDMGERSGILWYDVTYANSNQEIEVIVLDQYSGARDSQIIRVLPPTIDARMRIDGALKVNRRITINDISDTPHLYPTTYRLWSVVPVDAPGATASDIKHTGDWSSVQKELLFKKPGKYRVTLLLRNAAGYEDTAEKVIEILPDENPVALFTAPTEVYRQPEDNFKAIISLNDMSYSYDNDTITQRIWKYRYDSNNNGSFSDEQWVLLSNSNLTECSFHAQSVGKYEFSLECKESFRQSTIPAFITENDHLTDISTKVIEVSNTAPVVSLSMESKEKIDIVLAIGNTVYGKDLITEKVNSIIKPELFSNNVDANIIVTDECSIPTGKYAYDIYDGFSEWSKEEVVEGSRTNWNQYYGITKEPVLDPFLGYVFPNNSDLTRYGGNHWDYSPASAKYENEEIISYTSKTYYDVYDTRYTEEGGYYHWEHKYDRTHYNRTRYTVDYSVRNIKLMTVIAEDGRLPNNGRIMDNYKVQIERKYSGGTEKINVNLLGHWSIKKGPHVTSSLDMAIEAAGQYFRDNSNKYLVYITNDAFDSAETVYNSLYENGIKLVGLGTDENKDEFNTIARYNEEAGKYISNTNLDTAVNTLCSYILDNLQGDASWITKYVLQDDNIEIITNYQDYENDPQFVFRYIFTHDPNYFENSTGFSANAGKFLVSKDLKFDKTGKYEVLVQVQDNPSTNEKFSSYRKWSSSNIMTVYAHRKPVPVFSVKAEPRSSGTYYRITYSEDSYDLDHMSQENKGIIQKKWSYRKYNDTEWTEGKLPENVYERNITYFVKLDVMDMEYTWSSTIQAVNLSTTNKPPVAQFYFKENPVSQTKYTTIINDIVDVSADPDGDAINERKWTVKKGGNALPDGVNTVINTAGQGEYEVTLQVRDSKNTWSEPYTLNLIVVGDTTPPTLLISPVTRVWGTSDVSVTMQGSDTGGSGLKEIRYLWTNNSEFADEEFTTVATTGNVVRTQTSEGSWYLYAQVVDNSGNTSPIVKGGPYEIDKSAPALLDYRVTGADYVNANYYWIAQNKLVDIYVKAQELLSGMRYSYIRLPNNGNNRAYHDWTGTTTNITEATTSTLTDIIAAERTINDTEKGEYEVRFTTKGLANSLSSLEYNFTDKATNTTNYVNSGLYLGVDTEAPVLEISHETVDLNNMKRSVSVSASDSGSGVRETKYTISSSSTKPGAGGGWVTEFNHNFTFEIEGTGTWYAYIESTDNVGNVSDQRIGPFMVDMDAPVLSAVPINRVWDNEDVQITLTATEGYSSLQEVRYSISNNINRIYSGWQVLSNNAINQITLTEDGAWYLHAEAEDIAGNVTYTYFGPYRVDREPPELTMGYISGARYISGNNYYARQGDTVSFWFQGFDALSGIWRLLAIARDGATNPYRAATYNNVYNLYGDHSLISVNTPTITLNNGQTLRANYGFQVLTSGDFTYEIEGIADDLATYNRHGWVDNGYRLITDNTPPAISIDQASGDIRGNSSLSIVSADTCSGVKNISYVMSTGTTETVEGWTTIYSNNASVVMGMPGTFYLYVRSSDNVDNISSTQRYGPYNVIFNTPPGVNILGTDPAALYEGDSVSAVIQVSDVDLEILSLDVVLKNNTGSVIWTGSRNVSPSGGSYPAVSVPMISNISPGAYTIETTVTDTYGETASHTYSFTVADLSIDGFVNHTALWEENRQSYNFEKGGNINYPRPYDMFWSGERFMLNANTTNINPLSSVTANNVSVVILGQSYPAEFLSSTDGITWNGELWDVDMINKWGNDGPVNLTFRFTVIYSNGTVKTDDVEITVDNQDPYFKLHQKW